MISPARPPARRIAALLTGAITLVVAATGCGGGTGAGSGGGKVTSITALDYYTDEPEHTQWGEMLTACGRTAGVKVEQTSVPPASLVPKVLRQASSRTLPDLLMLDNPDLQQIAQTGALTPLDRFSIDSSGFAKGILSAGTYGGKVYGLAPYVSTVALFYNKDMLAKAGVAVPRTWGELKKAAAELTRPGRYGMAVDANATFEGTWQFLPFLWSNGGDERRLDTPQAARALQLWVDLVKSGSMSKSVLNWTQADVHDQFIAGRTAMMVNGPWRIPALNKDKNLRWGVAPIPVPRAGQSPVTPLGGEVWTVPQSSSEARQEKAAQVLACLNNSSNMLTLAKQHFTVPSRTAVAARRAEQVPSMAPFATSVETARSRTSELGVRWPKAATGIYTAIQSALTGEQTPEEALRHAQRFATGN
ncbi:sugar ABC transporter substrate-binding protein [Streptomyces sp. NBS 14/10]|uniref:sugar ABC transporter substrate-binding protein n=1 Tax=Streptomyces sp. NBS 14/10 TaxID=1945643 RepID=UPI0015C643A4|nr:sugar ABC transporter substrate-binding protein [Streptomyces sp. NBS 14/10]KAK1185520.1 sugar ABC transporter substrate-binding protein [Streptomyces sp. NBS 14/10]NUP40079.1 sugar ABC transporter substrate-binding protein [Streptomyces sp.]NUS87624.1 sugar ABC transporter substrate-binding protein [Streptomyces sp.]